MSNQTAYPMFVVLPGLADEEAMINIADIRVALPWTEGSKVYSHDGSPPFATTLTPSQVAKAILEAQAESIKLVTTAATEVAVELQRRLG